MSFLIPDEEIKKTLANADMVMLDVRQNILPRVDRILATTEGIVADLRAITYALRAIFVKQ